ncbi:Hypothetical predicted protein [Pelobates cultripes]|uniref:Uncharacterized protein n=1 Tax=Pelobates cultripes TaxID=61616 RepID=A0AAD1WP66_PELCU|nr:Hypothetical predicted protein [Pelobates cultripes]
MEPGGAAAVPEGFHVLVTVRRREQGVGAAARLNSAGAKFRGEKSCCKFGVSRGECGEEEGARAPSAAAGFFGSFSEDNGRDVNKQ